MIKHWIQAFADGGDATFGKFIQKAHKIGEITEFQGNFTNDLIIKHVKDAELFRNDCPLNNYSIMLKLETEKFREINRFISPGGIFNRIYPSKSLDLVYCFQAMNSSSKLISAPDHILATLTQDPLWLSRNRAQAKRDLRRLLTLRSIEIIQGGKFLFDVLAIPDNLDLNHSWDCLDIAFHLAKTKNELFTEEELQKLNLTTHFRTLEDINEVLDEMSEIWKVIEIEEQKIQMPAYTNYLKTQNLKLYLEHLSDFWRYPCSMLLRRLHSNTKNHLEIEKVLDDIMENFKEICRDMKPVTEQKLFYVVLERL